MQKMQFMAVIQGVVISRLLGCSGSSGNDGPALDDIAIGAFCPQRLPSLYLCLCACDTAIGATNLRTSFTRYLSVPK